jgi:hypothetical protein
MLKRIYGVLILACVAGCSAGVPPQMLADYQSRKLFTCCNIHYESDHINDANYQVGAILPFGTPAQVQKLQKRSVTFAADGRSLTLDQAYGTEQEPFEKYLDKVLVAEDPTARFRTFSHAAQQAIQQAHVERGMTREQVIMSLGYPPTHRTPSLDAPEWTYWYNRWVTFKVAFNAGGKVDNIIGTPAPTNNQPIPDEPPPRPSPAPKKRRK